MPPTVKAALAYVLPVFALAFAFGVLRVTLIAPRTGPLPAVALELPLVLALSWTVAGRVLARWPDSRRADLGLIAFALLMLLELATALALGQTPGQFLSAMATPPGALGLAGQVGFGLVPLLRPQPRG
ncbi:hypothetical protein [Tabrizicola soli]|uniref:Uncharacterized protein n=1 Tax=Tabrizicola soli TaxID=2185115 RepID=A0ABV7DVV8_9RHOB|nr:hypothetical protein [Tabrizicola soli]